MTTAGLEVRCSETLRLQAEGVQRHPLRCPVTHTAIPTEGKTGACTVRGYQLPSPEGLEQELDVVLIEGNDDEELLDVHLDDGLADQGSPEEGPEGHQEVAARDARQVKQRVRNLHARGTPSQRPVLSRTRAALGSGRAERG